VPKLPSFYIKDLASLIGKNKYEISGIRVGEKLHEEMISDHDSPNTFDLGNKYAIVPANLKNFYKKKKIKLVPGGFSYNSRTNTNFLTKNNLNIILKKFNFF
jgi:FlaA1/EpsC-like NDP-sugar epimerase